MHLRRSHDVQLDDVIYSSCSWGNASGIRYFCTASERLLEFFCGKARPRFYPLSVPWWEETIFAPPVRCLLTSDGQLEGEILRKMSLVIVSEDWWNFWNAVVVVGFMLKHAGVVRRKSFVATGERVSICKSTKGSHQSTIIQYKFLSSNWCH